MIKRFIIGRLKLLFLLCVCGCTMLATLWVLNGVLYLINHYVMPVIEWWML